MGQAHSGNPTAQNDFKSDYDQSDQQKIVKIQAHTRGRLARRDVKFKKEFGCNYHFIPNWHLAYLSSEPGLAFIHEIIFENGTQYKG